LPETAPLKEPSRDTQPPKWVKGSYPYSVYLGSYGTHERLQKAVKDYGSVGLAPYWVQVDLGEKGIWFRLFSGAFKTREEADAFIREHQIDGAFSRHTKYAVLIGTFRSEKQLNMERMELRAMGHSAYDVRGENVFGLFSGAFYQAARAQKQEESLASKGIRGEVVDRWEGGREIVGLRTKWIDFLYRVATGSRKFRNLLTPIGAAFYALLTVLFVVVALQADKFLKLPRLLPKTLNLILSLPIISLALFMMGWSVYNFLKVKGTPVPFNPPPKLITTGPYAHTRNPMLTGIFFLLFGLSFLFRSISLAFLFTPLFIFINAWEVKTIEEPELERRLGEEYVEYRKQTPMFFPSLKKIRER
jgi:protein-S-isoprenylcysteine O-methyltransferase Ste14/cell division septation protein DedD